MPLHPILSLQKNPTVKLNPQAVAKRQEAAAWVAQCIANFSWVESAVASLFVNLLGTNLPTGPALYADMASANAKDRALRSVALAVLKPEEYTLLEALLTLIRSHQSTRDKLAHWYWGACSEISDGLVLVDPRYLMKHRAKMIDLFDKGQITVSDAAFDLTKFFVVRVKDLQADAKDFAELAKLVFSLANLVSEKDGDKRDQRRLALSNDARIRSILARDREEKKKTPPAPSSQPEKPTRK